LDGFAIVDNGHFRLNEVGWGSKSYDWCFGGELIKVEIEELAVIMAETLLLQRLQDICGFERMKV
jgi:hypothetical protein